MKLGKICIRAGVVLSKSNFLQILVAETNKA